MPVQIGLARLSLDDNTISRIADTALEDVPRGRAEDAKIDLWCKNITGLPGTAVPVLVHEVFCEIEWFEQIIWFNRTDTRDQLWACTDFELEIKSVLHDAPATTRPQRLAGFGQHAACVMSVRREGAVDESLLELLVGYFSTQAGAPSGIDYLIGTAYINRAHFKTIFECVERYRERKRVEHEEFSRQARENETVVV
jgi:hypothetical protein